MKERGKDITQTELLWERAAVAGGLWASIEIIMGSFLHNLRIPFAGSILTMLGVLFLVSFFQIWPYRGMIWRAGLICALMKSISPSAVILGPMTGIFAEALLVECMILLLGKNITGYLAGGAMAMLSTLVHKLITLLLYYGMNLVVIFENFYSFAVRQVGQEPSNPWTVIFILSGIYVFAGLAAAAAGYTLGRKARKEPPETHLQVRSVEMPPLFEGEALNFSRLRLFFHVLMIPAGLFLLNSLPVVWGLSFVFFYVLLCLFYYPSLKKRLFRPGIWVQLMLIILLASFFIDNLMNNGKEISLAGLREGIKMSFRAVLVFTGFSAFGAEIRNPVIRNFMIRRGFANLYTALSLSFSILPGMIEGLTTPAEFFRNPFRSVKAMLVRAESWLGTVKTRDLRE